MEWSYMKMPNHRAIRRNEENTAHIPRRNQVRVPILINRIEMRIPIWIRLISPSSLQRSSNIAYGNLANMLMRTPPEDNLVCLDVDFIHETVLNPAIFGSTNRAEISPRDIDSCNQDGPIIGNLAFVDIDTGLESHGLEHRHEVLGLAVQRYPVDLAV